MPRILLIEDQTETAQALWIMLESLGYDVVWARNGIEALEIAKEVTPQAVLTDILMPQMDGLESLRRLRDLWPQVPLLAMTGELDGPYLQAAEVYGARGTLTKPFTREELKRVLDRAVGPHPPP